MLVSTKDLLHKQKVVPAFNFGTLEVARSVVEAAEELQAPFIFEINQKEVEFVGVKTACYLIKSFSSDYQVPFSLHLDHDTNLPEFTRAVELGFTSGLFDVSKMPVVEAFTLLDQLRRSLPKDFLLEVTASSVAEALQVEEHGADLLAIEKDNFCDIALLEEVRHATDLPFVMHGGSSRSVADIRKAVRAGVVKINFNTSLRLAWRLGLENSFKEQPDVLQSYVLLAKSRQLVKDVVKEKITLVRRGST